MNDEDQIHFRFLRRQFFVSFASNTSKPNLKFAPLMLSPTENITDAKSSNICQF